MNTFKTNTFQRIFYKTPYWVFIVLFSLSWSSYSFAAEAGDDFGVDGETVNHPMWITSTADTASPSSEGLLEQFYAQYLIQEVSKDSVGEDKVKVRVADRQTNLVTELKGSLVKGDGSKRFKIKHRYSSSKPVIGSDHNLEPLIRWYRETLSYPTYAIQLEDEKYNVKLEDYYEVASLSQACPNENFEVNFEDNPSRFNVEVFIKMRCSALKILNLSHSLGTFPYQIVGEKLTSLGEYCFAEGTMAMGRKVLKEISYKLPYLPHAPNLDQKDSTIFQSRGYGQIPCDDIVAKTMKFSGPVPNPVFGEYKELKEGSIKSPYLYVEVGEQGPEFFLTRTIETTLQKANTTREEGGSIAELKFTQITGLRVDAKVVKSSDAQGGQLPLRTGLLKQIASGEWYPASETYSISTAHSPYHLMISQVTASEPVSADQLVWDLYQARDIFYSQFMTLEIPHPFLPGGSEINLPKAPALLPNFYKIISISYPTFSLPPTLRVLKVGAEDQPRFTVTREHCAILGTLPLNRLLLINAQVREEDIEKAMQDYAGLYSDSLVDIKKGYCLETMDDAPPRYLRKQVLELERAKETKQEFRNFCRSYRG